ERGGGASEGGGPRTGRGIVTGAPAGADPDVRPGRLRSRMGHGDRYNRMVGPDAAGGRPGLAASRPTTLHGPGRNAGMTIDDPTRGRSGDAETLRAPRLAPRTWALLVLAGGLLCTAEAARRELAAVEADARVMHESMADTAREQMAKDLG